LSKLRTIMIIILLSLVPLATVPSVTTAASHETTDRVVLIELVTAGWCPNCPNADGALLEIEEEYTRDQVVILSYHRNDDLSNDDGDARQSFYDDPYQPDVFIDGVTEVRGNKGSVSANKIAYEVEVDKRLDKASPILMSVEGWTDTTTGEGVAFVNLTALSDPGLTDLRLHVAVFEDDFGPWNGGNGVLYHDWLTRELLTGTGGQTLDLTVGEEEQYSFTFDASGYAQDLDQVGILAFVQSAGTTKEVLQAGYVKEHVTTPVNSIPEFSNPSVTPETGNTSTTFRYEIGYRDDDDQRPVMAQVLIDGIAYDLQTDSTGPWVEWVPFYHETPLTVGDDHTYSFRFSDGEAQLLIPDPTSGPASFEGPLVEPPSSAPTLSLATIEPAEGDALTERTFSVVYTDGENDPPLIAQIVIDGVAHNMTGDGTDYQMGVTYTYSVVLDAGDHEFHFTFGDGIHGARLPASGENVESVIPDLERIVVLASHAEDGEVVVGESVTLGFDDDGVPSGLVVSYLWESDLDGVYGREAEVTFTPSEGTHQITLTIGTADGGRSYSTKINLLSAKAMATPVVEDVVVSPALPVENDIVTFTVTVGNQGNVDVEDLVVRLLDGNGDLLTSHTLTVPIDPGQTTKVTLEWESEEGTHTFTVEAGDDTHQVPVLVEENLEPLVTISVVGLDDGDKAEFDKGERIHFVGLGSDPEGEAITYEWNFGDGSTSDEVEPEHKYGKTGKFTVTVTVTDARGASSTDTFDLEVKENSTPGLAAFTIVLLLLVSALVAAVFRRR
jgi:thiol-disulfide isomerase/thioredoxin